MLFFVNVAQFLFLHFKYPIFDGFEYGTIFVNLLANGSISLFSYVMLAEIHLEIFRFNPQENSYPS